MHNGPTIYDDPSAIAVLLATTGSSVHGVVTFVRMGGVTLVNANLAGFKPNSTNGIQIYERGDCTARDASSAGERFDPVASEHNGDAVAQHHSGNLGNITADAKGQVYETFEMAEGAFGTGADSIIGRGLIVQTARDNLTLPPAAPSGTRLACGIITRNADRMTYAKAAQA